MSTAGPWMRREFRRLIIYLGLGVGALASLYPFYWMFTAATLTESAIFRVPPRLLPGGNLLENFTNLQASMPVFRALFNSVFVSGVSTVTTVFLSALAGYAFAKFRFRGQAILFAIVLFTLMVPIQILIVPLFVMMEQLGWVNSYLALIVPFMVTAFGVFLMRQQILGFPDDLLDAARIDGCGEFTVFLRIVLPNLKPAMAALGIITFLQQWANFLWPLVIVTSPDMFTYPLMLSQLVAPGQVVHYGEVMAGAAFGLIPLIVLFLFLQKFFVAGMFGGSVKG